MNYICRKCGADLYATTFDQDTISIEPCEECMQEYHRMMERHAEYDRSVFGNGYSS